MTECTAEFTIEPFEEGQPGSHVTKAIEAVEAMGLAVVVGPFGTTIEGSSDQIVEAIDVVLSVSLSEGATRVSVTVTNCSAMSDAPPEHPFFKALQPVLDAIGANPIAPTLISRSDVPIEWDGELIGGIRLQSLKGAVRRMVDQITDEFGDELGQLGREEKQQVVRMLDDRGAFLMRGAVEEVADLMDVSRITVYNYLNATSRSAPTRG